MHQAFHYKNGNFHELNNNFYKSSPWLTLFFANVSPHGFDGVDFSLFPIPLWPFLTSFTVYFCLTYKCWNNPGFCDWLFLSALFTGLIWAFIHFHFSKNYVCIGDSSDFYQLRFLWSTNLVNSAVIYLSWSGDFINISVIMSETELASNSESSRIVPPSISNQMLLFP